MNFDKEFFRDLILVELLIESLSFITWQLRHTHSLYPLPEVLYCFTYLAMFSLYTLNERTPDNG